MLFPPGVLWVPPLIGPVKLYKPQRQNLMSVLGTLHGACPMQKHEGTLLAYNLSVKPLHFYYM